MACAVIAVVNRQGEDKKVKENKTAIMITHDIAEAISLADRIIVLSKRPGKIKKIYVF